MNDTDLALACERTREESRVPDLFSILERQPKDTCQLWRRFIFVLESRVMSNDTKDHHYECQSLSRRIIGGTTRRDTTKVQLHLRRASILLGRGMDALTQKDEQDIERQRST